MKFVDIMKSIKVKTSVFWCNKVTPMEERVYDDMKKSWNERLGGGFRDGERG